MWAARDLQGYLAMAFSEAATKKRRGRPSVYTREMFGDQECGDKLKSVQDNLFSDLSDRARVNTHYYIQCQKIAEREFGRKWFQGIFVTSHGRFKNFGIAEQIGRMSLQNGYSDSDCITVLKMALEYLNEGYKVKEIERWIRHGRNTGEW